MKLIFAVLYVTNDGPYNRNERYTSQSSVCPSVRPSVTFRYCVQTNEDTIVRFSASGMTIPLVSG